MQASYIFPTVTLVGVDLVSVIFVVTVAYKQTGFSVLGALPPPETPGAWIANAREVGIGVMYFAGDKAFKG